MNYVKAKVVCNTDDIYTPVLDGKQVSLCDEEDIRTALGLNDVKSFGVRLFGNKFNLSKIVYIMI